MGSWAFSGTSSYSFCQTQNDGTTALMLTQYSPGLQSANMQCLLSSGHQFSLPWSRHSEVHTTLKAGETGCTSPVCCWETKISKPNSAPFKDQAMVLVTSPWYWPMKTEWKPAKFLMEIILPEKPLICQTKWICNCSTPKVIPRSPNLGHWQMGC